MFTYWRELEQARRPGDPFSISCPLSLEQWRGRARGRVGRAIDRYLRYPVHVGRLRLRGIVHVLDHSSAHLLDRIPARCRTVVTVHDLIPLVDPGGLTRNQVRRFRSVVARLERADRLVAVSEHTRKELMRLLGISAERIVVVPNGVCHTQGSAPNWSGRLRLDAWRAQAGGLVLGSVGSALPRKNLGIFAEVAALLADRGVNVALARAGAALPGPLRERLVAILGEDSVIEFGRMDSADLSAFYRSVDVVVVPSRREGFGLPVLEAMRCGVPVVSSNATSLPEVGGDAALYFDPDDAEGLASQLVALNDAETRARLADPCRQQAARFSWRRHLESCFSLYRELGEASA